MSTKKNAPGQEGRGMGTFAEPKGGDAEHTPRLPLPATRRAEILEALRRGERLTTADALRRGWGWRLAADIHRLRRYGWPVMSVLIDQGQGRNPIARYWMGAGVTP